MLKNLQTIFPILYIIYHGIPTGADPHSHCTLLEPSRRATVGAEEVRGVRTVQKRCSGVPTCLGN